MPSLSHTTGYAIEALACLARAESQTMRVVEIAEETGVPAAYLAKVFQRLGEAGIIVSKRGQKGGVSLKSSPDQLTLLDIDLAIGSHRSVVMEAETESRPHTYWEAFLDEYREKLASVTLRQVLAYEAISETIKL